MNIDGRNKIMTTPANHSSVALETISDNVGTRYRIHELDGAGGITCKLVETWDTRVYAAIEPSLGARLCRACWRKPSGG